MRKRALSACLMTGALVLIGAPAALAAPSTATFAAGSLTVTGDATAETFTISQTATDVVVTDPAGVTDPGAPCAVTATTVSCPNGSVTDVFVDAGGGNDTLTKNIGIASLDGGDGDDTLNAGTATLNGGDTGGLGNDTFNGSAQLSDTFVAEPGSDTYNGGTRVPTVGDTVDNPATFQSNVAPDLISYGGRTDALNVSLDNVANDGSAGELDNVGADVERVIGGDGNDTLTAAASGVDFSGGAGDDTLVGGSSDDFLAGDAGSDNIVGNGGDDFLVDGDSTDSDSAVVLPAAGNDTLDGGAGNDFLRSDRGADVLVGGPGFDNATFSRPIPQALSVLTPLQFAGFTISLDDIANDGATGAGEGDNVHSDIEEIDTGQGADVVSGSANAESFFTGGGNDTITPGAGADIVDAGAGDDTISAVDQTTDRIDCGAGNDNASVDLAGGQPTRADVTIDCEAISGQAFAAPVAPVDTSKPVLTITSKTIKAKAFRKDATLPLSVTCNKACSVDGAAFTTKAHISTVGQFSVGSGRLALGTGKRTLKVKIAKKYATTYKRRLRTKKQIKTGISFSVVVTVSDALGIQAKSTRTIKVKG